MSRRSRARQAHEKASETASRARWGAAEIPTAEYTGILKLGDLDMPCAVLPDGRRVLSQRGVMSALGRKYGGKDFKAQEGGEDGGGKLPFYLAASGLKPFIDNDLAAVVSAPIPYKHGKAPGA